MLLQRGLLCSGDVHLLPDHGHRLRAGCLSISPGWVHAGKPSSIFPAGAVWASMGYSYWRPSLKRYIHTSPFGEGRKKYYWTSLQANQDDTGRHRTTQHCPGPPRTPPPPTHSFLTGRRSRSTDNDADHSPRSFRYPTVNEPQQVMKVRSRPWALH